MIKSLPDRVASLLVKERHAALEGDFDSLARIAKEKEAILETLPLAKLSKAQMSCIALGVERNQSLLAAAISGLKSAQASLQMRRSAVGLVSFYNQKGAREIHNSSQPMHGRKF